MVSSVSFLLGSHLTLLFSCNTTDFTWATGEEAYRTTVLRMERGLKQEQNSGEEKRQDGVFPVGRKHVIVYGVPRTATTLLFNMVAVSNFLYFMHSKPQIIPHIESKYVKSEIDFESLIHQPADGPIRICKTHLRLDKFARDDFVVFSTAMDKTDAAAIKASLEEQGHDVAYVQDMETLKKEGIPRIAHDFALGYGLPNEDEKKLVDFFSLWEILRQCCGQQMSRKWRNDLTPEIYRRPTRSGFVEKDHPFCADYRIDEIENAFRETELYSLLEDYPNMRLFNKPSTRDKELNGTYCSSYNERVKTENLNFFGQPQFNENIRLGDWTEEEHILFLEGMKIFGTDRYKKIAEMVKTRTQMQIYWHMKEYLNNITIRHVEE